MIEIQFPSPKSELLKLRISGHSGSGLKGFDLVCAAVSGLALTLLQGLERDLEADIKGVIEEGNCNVRIRVPETRSGEMTTVAKIFRRGFRKLARTYPEFVRFS